jgi:hypothetical protein
MISTHEQPSAAAALNALAALTLPELQASPGRRVCH